MAPGRFAGLSRPGQTPLAAAPGNAPRPLARTSARTPDPGPGWSNLHIFMQTCGVQRGTVRLARTRRACLQALPMARARGPRPQAPCDGSRVAPFPADAVRTARPEEGQSGPARELAPTPRLPTDRCLFHAHDRESALFASIPQSKPEGNAGSTAFCWSISCVRPRTGVGRRQQQSGPARLEPPGQGHRE
jgi:hypothetical protein